jgi:hypothetical protein
VQIYTTSSLHYLNTALTLLSVIFKLKTGVITAGLPVNISNYFIIRLIHFGRGKLQMMISRNHVTAGYTDVSCIGAVVYL